MDVKNNAARVEQDYTLLKEFKASFDKIFKGIWNWTNDRKASKILLEYEKGEPEQRQMAQKRWQARKHTWMKSQKKVQRIEKEEMRNLTQLVNEKCRQLVPLKIRLLSHAIVTFFRFKNGKRDWRTLTNVYTTNQAKDSESTV